MIQRPINDLLQWLSSALKAVAYKLISRHLQLIKCAFCCFRIAREQPQWIHSALSNQSKLEISTNDVTTNNPRHKIRQNRDY